MRALALPMRAALRHAWAKPVVLVAALLPLAAMAVGVALDALGPNPAEYLIRATGDWTLRWLCVALAVTPLRVQLGWSELARFRRRAGLLVYLNACAHVACYALFDMGLELQDMAQDVLKRPFIWVGVCAWLLLTAMALTSPHRVVRWLGALRWRRLHRSVYAVALLAVLHFWWMRAAKGQWGEVAVYALVLASLLAWRAWRVWHGWRSAAAGVQRR